MSNVTKPSNQTTNPDTRDRESLIPGVPADFIIEAIRLIDRELAKLEGESSRTGSGGDSR